MAGDVKYIISTERTILLRENFAEYRSEKIILLDRQNNFVGILKITSNVAKNFFYFSSQFERSKLF